ncbi:MAG: YdcF family protein [Alphaproteobacteria bacterium]
MGAILRQLALVLLLLAGGFVWFAETVPWRFADDGGRTDAIVVPTGGRERIPLGIALLAAGRADKLLVTGVHPDVDRPTLLREMQAPAGVDRERIVLGHAAGDTRGNAAEAAAWMRHEGYRSLRLVTANYHLRRSALELARALPEATIVLHPVFPPQIKREWWLFPGTAMLLAAEYGKYLWSLARGWSGL